MPNDLDLLMDLDPLNLSAQDLDKIIEYQRKARQNWASGIKPKRGATDKKELDLGMLGLKPKTLGIVRRF